MQQLRKLKSRIEFPGISFLIRQWYANLNPLFDAGDGLHFSVAGYHRMGEVIYEESLRELLRKFLENN